MSEQRPDPEQTLGLPRRGSALSAGRACPSTVYGSGGICCPNGDEIVAVMRHTPDDRYGRRLRAMILVHHRRRDPRVTVVSSGRPHRVPWRSRSRGVRRRFAPLQLRHAHALELAREGVPLNIIQRQLGRTSLGTTSIHLQGIDPEKIITARPEGP